MKGTGLLISYNLQHHHVHQTVLSFHMKLQASFNPVLIYFFKYKIHDFSKCYVTESIFPVTLHEIIVQCSATILFFLIFT